MVWKAVDSQGRVIGTIEDNHPNVSVTIEAWRRAGFRVVHEPPPGQQQQPQEQQPQNKITMKVKSAGSGLANVFLGIARSASSTDEFKREAEEVKRTGSVHIEADPSEFISNKLMEKAIGLEAAASAHKTYTPYRALGAAMEASMRGEDVRRAIKQNIMGSSASLKAMGLGFLAGLASTPETIVLAPWAVKRTARAIASGDVVKQLSRPSGLAYFIGQSLGLSALGAVRLGGMPRASVYEMIPERTTVDIALKHGGEVFIRRSVVGEAKKIGSSTATWRPAGLESRVAGGARSVKVLTPSGTMIRMASSVGGEPDIILASTGRLVKSGVRKPDIELVDLYYIKNKQVAAKVFKGIKELREAPVKSQPTRIVVAPRRGGATAATVTARGTGAETLVKQVLQVPKRPQEVVVLEKPGMKPAPPANLAAKSQVKVAGTTSNIASIKLLTPPRGKLKPIGWSEPKPIEDVFGLTGGTPRTGTGGKHAPILWHEPKPLERPKTTTVSTTIIGPHPRAEPKPIIQQVPKPVQPKPQPTPQPILDTIPRPKPKPQPPVTTPITDTTTDTGTKKSSGVTSILEPKVDTKIETLVLGASGAPTPPTPEWNLKPKRRIKGKPKKQKQHKKRKTKDIFKELVFSAPDMSKWLGLGRKKSRQSRKRR